MASNTHEFGIACLAAALTLSTLSVAGEAVSKAKNGLGLYDRMSPVGRMAHELVQARKEQLGESAPLRKFTKDYSPNGDDGEDGPAGGQAEVSIAVDPTGQHIVVGYNDTRGFNLSPTSISGVAYSDDGGATFTDGGQLPTSGTKEVFGDPDVKYVPGGGGLQFIYSSILVTSTAQTICIHRSTDGGHTWQGPFEVTAATNPNSTSDAADKEFIDVDPDTGRVIVSWSDFTSVSPGGVEISTSYSTNVMTGNPPSWSARSVLNPGSGTFDTGSMPRFAGNLSNEVYVVWSRGSATTITSYGGWQYSRMGFAKSTDNGATWGAAVDVSSDAFPIDYILGNDRVHSFPGLAVDNSSGSRKGSIYLVYVDNSRQDGGDIAFQRSTNRGGSFSAPVFLNSRPGADRGQWFPYVCVDPATGRVNVIYDDQGISTSGDLVEMTWIYSDDGGNSWSKPTPLSTRPFHGGYGNDTGQPNLGDYNGAASVGGTLYAAFATTPEISPFTGGQPSSQFPYPSFLPGINPVGFRKATSASAGLLLGPVSFSDSGGNGFWDPGETALMTIPLQSFVTNSLSTPVSYTGVSATLTTTNLGVSVSSGTQAYPDIAPGAWGTNGVPFTIALQPGFVAGTRIEFALSVSTSQGNTTLLFSLVTGTPVSTTIFGENFDRVSTGSLPTGWSTSHVGGKPTVAWTTSSSVPQTLSSNALFHINANDGIGGVRGDSTRWERALSPLISVPTNASFATLDFDVWYNTEDDTNFNVLAYDGFLLRIADRTVGRTARSCLAEAFAEEFSTGGSQHYVKHLPRSGNTNYFEDMSVWGGYSGGWQHVHMKLPGIAGSTIQLQWEYTQDSSGIGTFVHPGVPLAGVAVDNLVMQSVVLMATPVLTWTNPTAVVYGAPLDATQLNASASTAGAFSYNPPAGTILTSGNHNLTVVFTPADTTHYLSVTGNVSAVVNPAPLSAVASNASRFFGQGNPAFVVTLTGVTNGDAITATATCSADSTSTVGPYPIVPSLNDPGNRQTNYQVSLVNGTLTISQAPATLLWTNPSAISYGTALGDQQLNASAGIPGTYTYNPTNGSILPAGTNTLSVAFVPTDAVDYSNATANVVLVVTDMLIYNGIDLTDPVQATGDADGDRLSNLLEYALGTDPNNPADGNAGLVFSVTSDVGGQYVSMQFKRRKSSPGLPIQYVPEVSGDRQNWFSDALNVSAPLVTPLDSEFDLVTVRDLTPTSAGAPRFIRLHIFSY